MSPAFRKLQLLRGASPNDGEPVAASLASPDADVSRALRELIDRFEGYVRHTASRHGLSGADLDEVVQDLRVRIWTSLGTADLIRRAKPAYLHRAAVSAVLDIIRRRRAGKSSGSSLDAVAPDALVDARASAESTLVRREVAEAVHEALGLLAESRRGVVRMYLAGYDRFEIAALMRWNVGKTQNLLYRGLEDLRAILASRGITSEGER